MAKEGTKPKKKGRCEGKKGGKESGKGAGPVTSLLRWKPREQGAEVVYYNSQFAASVSEEKIRSGTQKKKREENRNG